MDLTDGRTDRILLAIPRLHYMQRGKNVALLFHCQTYDWLLLLNTQLLYEN